MINIKRFSKENWALISKEAHAAVFGTVRDSAIERIDFVLVATMDKSPIGYITAREHDSETVYWQFGGVLMVHRGVSTLKAYMMAIEEMRRSYKRITTCILNTNFTMLKMAMKVGFIINGVKVINGNTLVELVKEL